jgi:hypothetical protein
MRKVRAAIGSCRPGAWAGANMCIEDDGDVSILTSQEKCVQLKGMCTYWLDWLERGKTSLDHKKLQSNHGFMVSVTQAYPGMKPYLKGFHLLLETWRGG